ncbi:hypothetical protein L1049_012730 [Liquidambar formosana]|uniref:Uncharacterized protein n=1 Tax=Liquidambar formosana TaxID=63359 RepID=A0AAP0WXA6_LIQFO
MFFYCSRLTRRSFGVKATRMQVLKEVGLANRKSGGSHSLVGLVKVSYLTRCGCVTKVGESKKIEAARARLTPENPSRPPPLCFLRRTGLSGKVVSFLVASGAV